jgi:hypothetical protein
MFKAIKEFFLGKPAEAPTAPAPYKVEAPVNPQITDSVTLAKPAVTQGKTKGGNGAVKKSAPKSTAKPKAPPKPKAPAKIKAKAKAPAKKTAAKTSK